MQITPAIRQRRMYSTLECLFPLNNNFALISELNIFKRADINVYCVSRRFECVITNYHLKFIKQALFEKLFTIYHSLAVVYMIEEGKVT